MNSTGIYPGIANSPTAGSRIQAQHAGGDQAMAGKTVPVSGQKLPAAPPPTHEQVRQAVEQIQSYLNDSQRQLEFQIDDGSGRTVVRVVNPDTHELIRQIPSEEVLTLSRAMSTTSGQLISDLA
ncbi:MAG: flagellar protein FlaG [Gammaproteobacteria bacterium]